MEQNGIEFDFDIDDLMKIMGKNVKEDLKSFEDLVNLDGSVTREVYIYDIEWFILKMIKEKNQ